MGEQMQWPPELGDEFLDAHAHVKVVERFRDAFGYCEDVVTVEDHYTKTRYVIGKRHFAEYATPLEPPPPAFKVGDRVRLKYWPKRGAWLVEEVLSDSTLQARLEMASAVERRYFAFEDLRLDPDPIAPYRRPSEALKQPVNCQGPMCPFATTNEDAICDACRKSSEAQGWQAYAQNPGAKERGVYHPVDPIAAAKAKCAETAERAAKMLGDEAYELRPMTVIPKGCDVVRPYNHERAAMADKLQTLTDENTKLHAQANRDRMRIEQLERQLRGKR